MGGKIKARNVLYESLILPRLRERLIERLIERLTVVMVARSSQAARLKLAMAAGGGTLLIFLAVLGGVVGWFSVSSPEELQHPEVRFSGMVSGQTR